MIHEFEGTEIEMSSFMAIVLELLEKLNEKANNVATRLLFLGWKVKKLKKEVKLLRLDEGKMEEEEEEDTEGEKEIEKEEA